MIKVVIFQIIKNKKISCFALKDMLSMSGFFISQLEQIRSGDRSLNLLEYIAELVVRHYYDVHDWYDDLDILNTSSGKV